MGIFGRFRQDAPTIEGSVGLISRYDSAALSGVVDRYVDVSRFFLELFLRPVYGATRAFLLGRRERYRVRIEQPRFYYSLFVSYLLWFF